MTRLFLCCLFVGIAAALSLGLPSCSNADADNKQSAPKSADRSDESRPFDNRLLEIAGSYQEYGRLDTEARWAIQDCAPPPKSETPAPPQLSASEDSNTHGHKLYWLFVKEMPPIVGWRVGYTQKGKPNPIGQVVVKEAWLSEEVDGETPPKPIVREVRIRRGESVVDSEDAYTPYVRRDGHLHHAVSKSALFIMYKTDPGTTGTDEGWVYGTVRADGKQVTSAGRVESCMGCHQHAPHDRLFGLAKE